MPKNLFQTINTKFFKLVRRNRSKTINCEVEIDSLTDDQVQYFREAFLFYDKDRDGVINSKELGALLKSLGQNPTESDIQYLINEADIDGSGAIDFTEFIYMIQHILKDSDDDISQAFRVFDFRGKGLINVQEIRDIMEIESVSLKEMDDILSFSKYSGNITFQEFYSIMKPDHSVSNENQDTDSF